MIGYVAQDNGVCANVYMIPDSDRSKDLCSGPDVNVASDYGDALVWPARADGHLLKDQAIGTNDCVVMDDDSVGMRQQQATSDL